MGYRSCDDRRMRYPTPLQPGDRIGVTCPSSGIDVALQKRLQVAIQTVEARGYEVVVGECMDGATHVSAPAADRARELMDMLTDPSVKAVVPPWGGETAIDLLPLIDWDALRTADPTWVVGYSDVSTIITPLTLLTGTATVHGNNLMDTPYRAPDGLLTWLDIVTMKPGSTFTQIPPGRYRSAGWDDYASSPETREFTLDAFGRWTRLDAEGEVEGRAVSSVAVSRRSATWPGRFTPTWHRSPILRRPMACSSTSRRPRTIRQPSAATCTGCGSLDSSLEPMQCLSAARGRPTRARLPSTQQCSTRWAASMCRSSPTWNAATSRPICHWSTAHSRGCDVVRTATSSRKRWTNDRPCRPAPS